MTYKPLLVVAALSAVWIPALAVEGPDAELHELFAAHEKALDGHDLKGLMALYAPGDKSVVLGTGPGEQWLGAAEIADAYQHFFADFDPGTLQRDCPWVVSDVSGDIGWISANCDYKDSLKDAHRSYSLNVSAVLQKLDGAWKLRAMHFSNLSNPDAK